MGLDVHREGTHAYILGPAEKWVHFGTAVARLAEEKPSEVSGWWSPARSPLGRRSQMTAMTDSPKLPHARVRKESYGRGVTAVMASVRVLSRSVVIGVAGRRWELQFDAYPYTRGCRSGFGQSFAFEVGCKTLWADRVMVAVRLAPFLVVAPNRVLRCVLGGIADVCSGR